MTLVLNRTRVLAGRCELGMGLRARSIKPLEGGRWRLRQMRDGGSPMGFLSCTELQINSVRDKSVLLQLDHGLPRREHSTRSVCRASGFVQVGFSSKWL